MNYHLKRISQNTLAIAGILVLAVSISIGILFFNHSSNVFAAAPLTASLVMNPAVVDNPGDISNADIDVQNASICWLVGTDPSANITLPAGYSTANCATQTLPPAATGPDVFDTGFLFCPSPIPGGSEGGPIVIDTTAQTTWTVPADWSNSNTIHVIGAGGGGASGGSGGGGGGGGAYSSITNLSSLTPGQVVTIQVGTGGTSNNAGGDTWFNGASCAGSSVCAKGGSAGGTGTGSGGAAASGVGSVRYSGGVGGDSTSGTGSAGGGGAGGPNGNGANGGYSSRAEAGGGGASSGGGNGRNANADGGCWLGCGGTGGNRYGTSFSSCKGNSTRASTGSGCMGDGSRGGPGASGGGGGGGDDDGSNWQGGNGGSGINITGTLGSGGGGGGGRTSGGGGGLYGGGGGGGARYSSSYTGGTGGRGVIVIYYTKDTVSSATQNSDRTINEDTKYVLTCNDLDGVPAAPQNFTVRVATSCTLDGITTDHGQSYTFFPVSSVPFGSACSGQSRTCNDGTFGGNASYSYGTCTVSTAANCTLDGVTVAHDETRSFYSQPYAPNGGLCGTYAANRTCTNGTLDGNASYSYGTCSVADLPILTAVSRFVRRDSTARLEWDVHVNDPASCTFTGPGAPGTISETEGFVDIPIEGSSTFTLTCMSGSTSVTVNIIPGVYES